MNTKNLKSYAPKARKQFIEAVKKRAAHFGIYEDLIAEVRIEGGAAIIEGRAFTRKEGEQRKRLESKLAERGYDMFTREIAYTWFNRLAALRYMEIHDYFDHGFRVLSPAKSHLSNADGLPEILNHASDVAESLNLDKDHIIELQLAGDKEEELYRELLLGQCHQLAKIMPQIFKGLAFETIDDATELLLPNNLTKTDSILKGLINDIPEEDWQDIEVIGWLYQFYISEHKDSVIGKVVKSEDIPAATQLFTPNWIVKYLVQNSVGRQWLATYPDSELKSKMEYYIEPAEQSEKVIEQLKAITPTSIDPEEIKVLDPACGSGHILVEVYEVLREIYLERGYRLREIPELILTKNIYGLDIDDRAAQLAGFALMMKAREDDRRIFQRVEDGEVTLNVLSLQSSEHLDIHKLWNALDLEGKHQSGTTAGLFDEVVQPNDFAYNEQSDKTIPAQAGIYADYYQLLKILKTAFLQAKTFGSLIHIDNQHLEELIALKELLQAKEKGSDPAAMKAAIDLMPIVKQTIFLAKKYDAVIANPPYMSSKAMNVVQKDFANRVYPDSKPDLYTMFIEKCLMLIKPDGVCSLVTMQSWMFLSVFDKLRKKIIENRSISNLTQIGYNSFPELNSKVVQCCIFSISSKVSNSYKSTFINLNAAPQSACKKQEFLLKKSQNYFYTVSSLFLSIPNAPFVYWFSKDVFNLYKPKSFLGDFASISEGIKTGDNERFLRFWHEIDHTKLNKKWFLHNKGGLYRRWYGNTEHVVNWENDGASLKAFKSAGLQGKDNYFNEGIVWSKISSSKFSARFLPQSVLFDSGSPACFPSSKDDLLEIIGYLQSEVARFLLSGTNPTLATQVGNVSSLPFNKRKDKDTNVIKELISIYKKDWDEQELSVDFKNNPICANRAMSKLKESTNNKLKVDQFVSEKAHRLDVINDQAYIAAYNLENSLRSELMLKDVTLFANKEFIFKGDDNAVNKMISNTVISLVSYFIGNLMGRYSLDREGLMYAKSGNEGFNDLVDKGVYNSFTVDDDGITPLASEEWLFDDDATTRFKEFVKTVWGDENLTENLEFVAESLCLHALKPLSTKKGSSERAMDTIRRYFSTQFFKDHCKTYKKRPIYWLFSSGKEKAFECLVYLHRYNEGTLSRMRTEYVTPLMGKYEAQHTLLSEQQLQATGTEARGIEKDLKSLEKKQAELRTFDEQLKHYAEKRIKLDLDDGVKANYGKFGNLLADVKAIHGKAVK